eukprot:4979351-Pyramimonas_sp.AAC.1
MLLRLARKVGYPAALISLDVQQFLAPRYLQERAVLSRPIFPSRSIVAGFPRGVGLAKLFLHPILEFVHRRSPAAGLWTFVDDTTARCEGSRAP